MEADPAELHRAADHHAFRARRVLSTERFRPRHVDLRPYILFGDKVTIVPGGLTRVALRQGIAGGEFVAGRRQQGYLGAALIMLSRVADSLFWMSRYLERAEHTARVMNVQLNLMLERGAGSDDRHWARVLRSLGVEHQRR